MQAMRVRRLSDAPSSARLYLDGKRVTRAKWEAAHLGRRTDTHCTRITTRKRDGAEIVREYHCIRRT
jgi:hypothetical protein